MNRVASSMIIGALIASGFWGGIMLKSPPLLALAIIAAIVLAALYIILSFVDEEE